VRVLVTGSRGQVGAVVAAHLSRLGHEVTGFDRLDGDDLLDPVGVRRAAAGCAGVVHAGALAHDSAGRPEDIMAVNVLGTWHVLLAAEAAGAGRVVYFSSGQVFGTAEGERLPDYFPVDDAHPRRAMRPYGLSKVLAEDLCAGFTARTGMATVALRPAWVWHPGMYRQLAERWQADPAAEWTPTWEYGQFVDVRDVADAVQRALSVPLTGHHRLLLCAADTAATRPSLVMAGRFAASVPVREAERFEEDPSCSLFDTSAAAEVLGWAPRYRWSARGANQGG
jgi:UDP-glucose 4-epimerase